MKMLDSTKRAHRRGLLHAAFGSIAFSFVLFSAYKFSNFLQDYAIKQHLDQVRNAKPLSDLQRIRLISRVCGPLCDPEAGVTTKAPGSNRTYRRLPLNRQKCRALYQSPYMFAPLHGEIPPRTIPTELIDAFTMNGRISIKSEYKNNVYLGNEMVQRIWTREVITKYISRIEKGELHGTYGVKLTSELFRLLRHIGVKGKRALVVGSEKPWVEAALLASGARETVTLEFAHIKCEDSRMRAYTPANFSALMLADRMEPFDVIVSYSSNEHSGLARYGDALNPWGDVIAVAEMWCVAKQNAHLILEVPRAKKDLISFNVHRWYSTIRLPFLTTNWVLDDIGDLSSWSNRSSEFGMLAPPMVFRRMQ